MSSDKSVLRVQEFLHHKGDDISSVEYVYDERFDNGKTRQHRVHIKKSDFDRITVEEKNYSLKFDDFIDVTRPLLLGTHHPNDIHKAFRLLDTDQSDTIDIHELAIFMPCIVPKSNSYMLLRHFEKADTNKDYKLNLDEFTDFVKKNLIRDMVIGRV